MMFAGKINLIQQNEVSCCGRAVRYSIMVRYRHELKARASQCLPDLTSVPGCPMNQNKVQFLFAGRGCYRRGWGGNNVLDRPGGFKVSEYGA